MQDFFKETNHSFITKRCLGETKCLYQGCWNIAYENQNYFNLTPYKNNAKAKKIKVENLETKECKEFNSYAEAERYFNVRQKAFSGKAYKYKNQEHFIILKKYKIYVLN